MQLCCLEFKNFVLLNKFQIDGRTLTINVDKTITNAGSNNNTDSINISEYLEFICKEEDEK